MKNYTILHQPAMTIIGIACRTSNAPDKGPHDIPKLWQQFYTEKIMDLIPHKASNEIIALYCDYEGDYTKPYTLVIGCQTTSIEQIPPGMVLKTIPATSYAVFHAIGEHPHSLISTWQTIWQTPLNRTYTGDYEAYGDRFFSKSPQEVEVFIAIKLTT